MTVPSGANITPLAALRAGNESHFQNIGEYQNRFGQLLKLLCPWRIADKLL
ncbi:hypothetical protein [Paraburkholderia sp. BL23I1N1]|uniref:hypothetical protein n=1 Tax=Paraburkholderia sp. BL23I1N1 TaxID=1938802 RepID=UPI00217E128A|nr:hypothetical protein [Paraburkholderia sp. BL23I1N1]